MANDLESQESGAIESIESEHEAAESRPAYTASQVNAALARSAKNYTLTQREEEMLREWLEGVSRDYLQRIKQNAGAIDSLLMEEIRQDFVTSIDFSRVTDCVGADYLPHTQKDRDMLKAHAEKVHEAVRNLLVFYLNGRHTSVVFTLEGDTLSWKLRPMR